MLADFFDTNVLIYLASDDENKSNRAQVLITSGGIISVQVLNEIANVLRRKRTRSWQEVREFLEMLKALIDIEPVSLHCHENGLILAERYQLAIYDAMLVSAALLAGCRTFWSEDMQDGLVVEEQLTIRNPFRGQT